MSRKAHILPDRLAPNQRVWFVGTAAGPRSAAVGAYYTYEKDRSTNQWATLTGTALNNLLNYAGSDTTDTLSALPTF